MHSLLELIGPSYMVHAQISTQAVAILSLIYVNGHITFIESFIIYGDKEQGMLFYIGGGAPFRPTPVCVRVELSPYWMVNTPSIRRTCMNSRLHMFTKNTKMYTVVFVVITFLTIK